MKLSSRRTHNFIELKVDEMGTTIFKHSEKDIEDTIHNLLDICNDLAGYTNKSVKEFLEEGGH